MWLAALYECSLYRPQPGHCSKMPTFTGFACSCHSVHCCPTPALPPTLSSIVILPRGVLLSREMSKYTSGLACNAYTHTRMHTLWSAPGHCSAGGTADKVERQLPAHGVGWAQGRHVVALGLGSSNNCLLAGATRGVSHGW